jgi:hypothetical protein
MNTKIYGNRILKTVNKGDPCLGLYKSIDGEMNATFGCKCLVTETEDKFIVEPLEENYISVIFSDKLYRSVKPIEIKSIRVAQFEV